MIPHQAPSEHPHPGVRGLFENRWNQRLRVLSPVSDGSVKTGLEKYVPSSRIAGPWAAVRCLHGAIRERGRPGKGTSWKGDVLTRPIANRLNSQHLVKRYDNGYASYLSLGRRGLALILFDNQLAVNDLRRWPAREQAIRLDNPVVIPGVVNAGGTHQTADQTFRSVPVAWRPKSRPFRSSQTGKPRPDRAGRDGPCAPPGRGKVLFAR